MTTVKGYDPDSERGYAAPEAPRIVEPESRIHKWIKNPILYFILGAYLCLNAGDFFMANGLRKGGMSKFEIEELIDKNLSDKSGLGKFILDDLTKPGRELGYLVWGDGEQ